MAKRLIGDLGEDDFLRWCTLNELLCTKSTRDRLGWDYFVEFPPQAAAHMALDAHRELKKALVQVKASEGGERSVLAKLSALKYLVDADLPSFLIVIHYNRRKAPHRAWLLHVGKTEIEVILRKVRLAESRGAAKLNSTRMRLSLEHAVPLQVDGSDLRRKLEAAIGSRMARYVEGKADFRGACGYQNLPFVGSVMLGPGIGLAEIAGWQVGRIPHLPIASGVISKVRFGLTLPNETFQIGAALAQFDLRPLGEARVAVSTKDFDASVEMTVDFYSSDPSMGEGVMKVRLANKFLDIYLPMQGPAEIKFEIDTDRQFRLSELAMALKLGWVMVQPGARMTLSLNDTSSSIYLPAARDSLGHFKHLHRFAELLSTALHRFQPDIIVELTVGEIEEAMYANERSFGLLTLPGFGAIYEVGDEFEALRENAHNSVMMVPVCMTLKKIVYYAVVCIDVKEVRLEKGELRLTGGEPHVAYEGIGTVSSVASIVERLSEQVLRLRAQENERQRMVVGMQGVVVGLGNTDNAMKGAISW